MNVLKQAPRRFLPDEFKITVWSRLKPYYAELLSREIQSVKELENWILDRSELQSLVQESFAWRYIRLTTNTSDDKAEALYTYALQELQPKIAHLDHQLNQKIIRCPYVAGLNQLQYGIYLKHIQTGLQLYTEENANLLATLQVKAKESGRILASMVVEADQAAQWSEKKYNLTLQQASQLLENPSRSLRQDIYHKINQTLRAEGERLEDLFDELVTQRAQIATNAGFDNFRDYAFKQLRRYDYTPENCLSYHDAIATHIVPILQDLYQFRQQRLGVDTLCAWDLNVDVVDQKPFTPFNDSQDMLAKAITCLRAVNPGFGEVLELMRSMNHLDIESRPFKRPGAYNVPLPLTGAPFLFMHATGSFHDMRTLLHESGHAIHSYLIQHKKVSSDLQLPAETAELAAMTMELLSMEHWAVFFNDKRDLLRARFYQLEHILRVLPWVATIDSFQHWVYLHPHAGKAARQQAWTSCFNRFTPTTMDRTESESYIPFLWQKQLHLFEAPFYYIEYGIAQMGAIQIWKSYCEAPEKTIQGYMDALSMGASRSTPVIYEMAGSPFRFDAEYIQEIAVFLRAQVNTLIVEMQAYENNI